MVAETGSVLQAAKQMGVNHATVLRHVAGFEGRHGEKIFEKTPQGYRIIPDRAHVIIAAQRAAAAIGEVNRLASSGRNPSRLALRITSTDTLASCVLPRFVSKIAGDYPSVTISLHSSNAHESIILDSALVFVRPAVELPPDLAGDNVAALGFAAYAKDANASRWLGLSGPLARSLPARWMAENIQTEETTQSADSFLILRELAALGHGIAPLPCFVGDRDERLRRMPDAMPVITVPIWVAHPIETVQSQQLRDIVLKLKNFLASEQELPTGKL